jgi:RNase P/RNase MRP subunit p29
MPPRKPKVAAKAGKMRLELRIDADLMQAVQELAQASELSVNQLVGGIVRGVVREAHVGWAGRVSDADEEIVVVDQAPGAVWFGDDGIRLSRPDGERVQVKPASLWFALNYRDDRAVVSGRCSLAAAEVGKDKSHGAA